jgi:hypothetical protein
MPLLPFKSRNLLIFTVGFFSAYSSTFTMSEILVFHTRIWDQCAQIEHAQPRAVKNVFTVDAKHCWAQNNSLSHGFCRFSERERSKFVLPNSNVLWDSCTKPATVECLDSTPQWIPVPMSLTYRQPGPSETHLQIKCFLYKSKLLFAQLAGQSSSSSRANSPGSCLRYT